MAIYTERMKEIVALLEFIEQADVKYEHLFIKDGIVLCDPDETDIVIGRLRAIDGGVWEFEPEPPA